MTEEPNKGAAHKPRHLSEEGLARIRDALRSLPRDHFIEMSEPSIVIGRSIPPTNAVSEILEHADVQPDRDHDRDGPSADQLVGDRAAHDPEREHADGDEVVLEPAAAALHAQEASHATPSARHGSFVSVS